MACAFNGNPDMYGVGIRTAFYLLWFGSIFAAWLAPADTYRIRDVTLLFIAATFLGLIIQVSTNSLRTVEIYIVLLLAFGTYYAYLPLYLWRLLTGCSPFWDPSRWPRVAETRIWSILDYLMLFALTIFELWFWATGINVEPTNNAACPEYGFFFAMVLLRNQLFIALNIILSLILMLCCVGHFLFATTLVRNPRWLRKKLKKAKRKGISDGRKLQLQLLDAFFRVTVASLVITAIELTIQWNNINGVNDASTVAQLIPIILVTGLLVHAIWMFMVRSQEVESDTESTTVTSTVTETVEVTTD